MTTTDTQAFGTILLRLKGDVGKLLRLAQKNNTFPFWAFLRMIFPIIESMGDLVYEEKSSQNLYKIFTKEFSRINPKYKEVAALLILLYRHTLIHKDELGVIVFENVTVVWGLQFEWGSAHLEIKHQSGQMMLMLNINRLYKDTRGVCERLYKEDFGGRVGRRYEKWKEIRLFRSNTRIIDQQAIKEIEKLTARWLTAGLAIQR